VILPMASLQILGPRRLLPDAVALLQREGVLELREAVGARRAALVPTGPGLADLDAALRRIDALLASLPRAPAAPSPASLPSPGTPAFDAALDALAARLDALASRRAALQAEATEAARLARLLGALVPLRARAPLPARARALGLALRRDRADAALPALEREVSRLTDGAYDLRSSEAGDEVAILLAVPESRAPEVSALLLDHGVGEVRLPGAVAARGPARGAVALASRAGEIPRALEAIAAEVREVAGAAWTALSAARRGALSARERLLALGRCGETGHAFVLAGYALRAAVPRVRAALAEAFAGRVQALEHEIEDLEAVPVVLSNGPWLRPFERLLSLAPLPRYGSVDPTPWLAVFYPLFLGLVVADLGCAALAAAVALAARARGWGGSAGRDAAAIALAAAAWAALFGVLFGEAFGELGAQIGIHPILLDRRRALLAFLGVALGAGGVHLAAGLALGVWSAAREGEAREAIGRAARLALLGAAAVGASAVLGALPPSALRPALWTAGASVAASALAEGPLALLEALLTAGNVLSYARLMALGAASVMLAEAANGLAHALPGPFGVALAVLLHGVNFTLGLLSPAIASLRLQYVEFFEKFYREGGHPFRPFALA